MILYAKKCPLRVVWGWKDEIGHHFRSPLKTENFTGVKEGKIIDASAYVLPAFTSSNPLPKLLEFMLILERDDGMEGTFCVIADTDSVREQDQWEARLAMKEYK